jgi:NitT/TauT family transport system substrate-binding protein
MIVARLNELRWAPRLEESRITVYEDGKLKCESNGRIMKRILFSIVILLWTTPLGAADRIRIGYSSISGAYIGLWVAHDGGYFAKEGLDDQMILIPSGTQLAQVTVAGEIDIGLLNGSSAMAAALQGADLKVIGNAGNKMIFSLYVRPEIKTVEALKGKKIGITRYGSAPDISIRYALKKYNLNPEKDLTLIQLGFMATVAGGLNGGSIDGGVVSPPTLFAVEKLGFKELINITDMDFAFPNPSLVAVGTILKSRPEVIIDLCAPMPGGFSEREMTGNSRTSRWQPTRKFRIRSFFRRPMIST